MTTTSTTSTAGRGAGRRGGVTEQAADATVDQACRMLRLPTMRARFGEVADAAQREQLTYRGFLAELLMAECDDRCRRTTSRVGDPALGSCHEFTPEELVDCE